MKKRNLKKNHDHWETPDYFYDKLNKEFNFTFDPCPLRHDIKKWDGLKRSWGKRNFVNSPYSDDKITGYLKSSFVKKAIEESKKGKLCVLLLPVSTSTILFHDYILPNAKEIRFVKTRIKFIGVNTKGKKVKDKVGMYDNMVVIFDGQKFSKYTSLVIKSMSSKEVKTIVRKRPV